MICVTTIVPGLFKTIQLMAQLVIKLTTGLYGIKDDPMKSTIIKRQDGTEFEIMTPESKYDFDQAMDFVLKLSEEDMNAIPLQVWQEWHKNRFKGCSQVEIIKALTSSERIHLPVTVELTAEEICDLRSEFEI